MIAGQVPTLDSKAGYPATRKLSGSQGRKRVTQEGGRSEEASVKRTGRGRGPGDMGGCCYRHALGSEQLPQSFALFFQQQEPCVKPDHTQNPRHKPGGNRVAQIGGKEEMEPDPPTSPCPYNLPPAGL